MDLFAATLNKENKNGNNCYEMNITCKLLLG